MLYKIITRLCGGIIMAIKKVIRYETSYGSLHETMENAEIHEAFKGIAAWYNASPSDESYTGTNRLHAGILPVCFDDLCEYMYDNKRQMRKLITLLITDRDGIDYGKDQEQ